MWGFINNLSVGIILIRNLNGIVKYLNKIWVSIKVICKE